MFAYVFWIHGPTKTIAFMPTNGLQERLTNFDWLMWVGQHQVKAQEFFDWCEEQGIPYGVVTDEENIFAAGPMGDGAAVLFSLRWL